jgi:hypothetical protein
MTASPHRRVTPGPVSRHRGIMADIEPAAAPREPLPRHTTPTWEMELLISGATVFTLFQLPAALDTVLYRYAPQLDRSMSVMLMLPYVYLTTAVYALIVTFVLHLATRGYWVAITGLHSVYPDGVRWEKLRWGPNYLATMRRRTPPMKEMIERADNRASLVFGYGIGFAVLMLAPLAFAILVGLVAGMLVDSFDQRYSWTQVWSITFAALFAPFGIAVAVDRFFGRRLSPEGATARLLRRVFGGYLRAGFSSFISFPVMMFVSRVGAHRGTVAMLLGMFLLTGAVLLQLGMREGELRMDGYRYLPALEDDNAHVLDPEHYADQRTAAMTLSPRPFIQSEVVRGDYLRLFVPYRPARDNAALERRCPQLLATPLEPETSAALVLDCLASIYNLRVDGVAQETDFVFAEDATSGQRGVVAMLPMAALERGRHELRVDRPPRADAAPDAPPAPPFLIMFWR